MMPAQPTAQFVLVQTDFAFGFFKNDFNRPTHATNTHQFADSNRGGSVAEVEFELAWIIQIAANDQPNSLVFGKSRRRAGRSETTSEKAFREMVKKGSLDAVPEQEQRAQSGARGA